MKINWSIVKYFGIFMSEKDGNFREWFSFTLGLCHRNSEEHLGIDKKFREMWNKYEYSVT